MKRMARQRGLTLIEMLVVVGIIAALVGFGAPAVKALLASFESEDSIRAMIQTALGSARAMAIEQQRYVGIRFQKVSCSTMDGRGNPQYMTFIIHDTAATGLASGFRAVEGLKPIRLPDLFGVMDLIRVDREKKGNTIDVTKEYPLSKDQDILTPPEVNDVTTFSIVFSPTGHLVAHQVRVRSQGSRDSVFNTDAWVLHSDPLARRGMFLQDDYIERGLGPESSRRSFVIYRTREFEQAFRAGNPYGGYLKGLASKVLYVTPLTGALTQQD
jgi:prepilin-type N-terminal cleavage/methylation domain-containing protein